MSGEYFGYVRNLIENAATHLENIEAKAVSEVVLEATDALWGLTMDLDTRESLWNLMEVVASLCSLVEPDQSLQKISRHQNSL
jgi:hypothetical protein